MHVDGALGVAVLVISDYIPVFLNGSARKFLVPAHVRAGVGTLHALAVRRGIPVVQVGVAAGRQLPAGGPGRNEPFVHLRLRPAAARILRVVEVVASGRPGRAHHPR